jgi:hypothetical protein
VKSYLAVLLSVLIPGLGQLYNRQFGKAVVFFFGNYVPLGISSRIGGMLWKAIYQGEELSPGSPPFWALFWFRGFMMLIALIVRVTAVVDAWRKAKGFMYMYVNRAK